MTGLTPQHPTILMNRLLFLLALFTLSASAQEKIYLAADETEALLAKEGQKVVVYGETKGSGKSGSGTNFVNFRGAAFFLVTFKSDLAHFPDGEPADLYEGKRIAVEGALSIYQGKPQIKLTEPAQVTLLAPDAVFPPPSETKEKPKEKPADSTPPKAGNPSPSGGAPASPRRKSPFDRSE